MRNINAGLRSQRTAEDRQSHHREGTLALCIVESRIHAVPPAVTEADILGIAQARTSLAPQSIIFVAYKRETRNRVTVLQVSPELYKKLQAILTIRRQRTIEPGAGV